MTEDIKSASLRAFQLLLRPVVRILLRGGITWKEAAEACKATFVEVATEDYGLHGRPTSVSRVAILTGIARREVSRVRQLGKSGRPVDLGRMNAAMRVLTGWHLDPEFAGEGGAPRLLPLEGESGSFASLARRYCGDIAMVTMLHELTRAGAIATQPDGRLKVLTRYYMPVVMDTDAILQAASLIHDAAATADYNLVRPAGAPTRFLGRASNARIRAGDVPAFREFLEREGQGLLERADAWLEEHEVPADSGRRQRIVRLGVGVFQVEED